MDANTVVQAYLKHLQEGNMAQVVALFSEKGLVVSPIYGTRPAAEFYSLLAKDTQASELHFNGLFEEKDTGRVALLFDYHWTLRHGKKVTFTVVDILELDQDFKITKLSIIYDTVVSRELVKSL